MMGLTWRCSTCWAEVPGDGDCCPHCGARSLTSSEAPYTEKLIAALRHPVPETRALAAIVLGHRHELLALPALAACLREEADMGVLAAVVETLGRLEDCRAVAPLAERLARPVALAVALAIVRALADLAHLGCAAARDVLASPPPHLPERAAREIRQALAGL